jgi:hypothetical protein
MSPKPDSHRIFLFYTDAKKLPMQNVILCFGSLSIYLTDPYVTLPYSNADRSNRGKLKSRRIFRVNAIVETFMSK